MNKTSILLIIFCFYSNLFYSQEKQIKSPPEELKPIASDCKEAIQIPLVKRGIYGPTVAPKGFGKMQEIKSSSSNDVYFFAKEHNSAWYYFDIKIDGELIFEILPLKKGDDYDFLLFKWSDTICCHDKSEFPIRTNLSRSGKNGTGRTGLWDSGLNEYIKAGSDETFSKPIPVRKKERYYLVLDNVTSNGKGHTIKFYYLKPTTLSGIITDEKNNPIKATLNIKDIQGEEVFTGESDSSTGRFYIQTKLIEGVSYMLNVYNDRSFISSLYLNADSLASGNYMKTNLKIGLPKLIIDNTYLLEEVRFNEHSIELSPPSYIAINNLFFLLEKNKNMRIEIEGHANDPFGNIGEESCLKLSTTRAKKISDLLIAKGIKKERITINGHGRNEMLFPNAISQSQYQANRRVEIKILSIK